jgi:membrane protein implicated in regulation of membrane protease activity
MKTKTKYVLIAAETLGFFVIISALLGIMTEMELFSILCFVLLVIFSFTVVLFAIFFTRAFREEKTNKAKQKKKIL